MEIGNKVIAAGVGLFILGGLSVYLLMDTEGTADKKPISQQHSAMQAAIAQLEHEKESPRESESTASTQQPSSDAAPEMTHAAFLAEAEARREQSMENKAEAERLEKLRHAKQNSVECKFWKQQQTSSASTKIEEKIKQHCTLPGDASSESQSSNAAPTI